MNLKKDGRYESTGGAAYGEINRLYFMGKIWEQDILAQMDYQRYYRKDMVCDEVYRRDAVDYYNGCLVEMEKILSLCKEKEDAQGLVELEKEQQLWQENFDRRLQDTLSFYRLDSMEDMLELDNRYLYFSYGDMMLRRTLRLVDRYFDLDVYE